MDDTLFFIDANIYLDLYRIPKEKQLLPAIKAQQEHIFITKQVADEVQRNKLRVTAEFLAVQVQKLQGSFDIPAQLLNVSPEPDKLLGRAASIRQMIEQVNAGLTEDAVQMLQRVSRSEDEVSKVLGELFRTAAVESTDELQRARLRKERGNPPGKADNPLGDQITWEQLLSHAKGKSKVWIISKDTDYCVAQGGKLLLNSFLYEELAALNSPPTQVFCFNNLGEGLTDFVEQTGGKAETLPTPEELKEIKEEALQIKEEITAEFLPPVGWLSNVSVNEAANAIIQQHYAALRRRVAAFYTTNNIWTPGMPPDEPRE
jgi:hypothetical protein